MSPIADEELNAAIDDLISQAGVRGQRSLVRSIVRNAIGLGVDGTRRLDLKIVAAAVEEMRRAFRTFAPFVDDPKVTIFGSARTQIDDPLYQLTETVAREFAARGWTVVTGAGPGIMEAGASGAGADHSLGVSIHLPFEETPSEMVAGSERLVSMKYFFTRKLMLVKESRGFICLPGGFGTMDEMFELLTLQQTGKMVPVPIVLLDRPGGTFWRSLERFALEELEGSGMISKGDLDRMLVTDSEDAAIAEITGFWRNYDSLRWIPGAGESGADLLVLRLRAEPTESEVDGLNERFARLCAGGRIERVQPHEHEIADRDRLELPRLALTLKPREVGELHRLVRALNELDSAPAVQEPAHPSPGE